MQYYFAPLEGLTDSIYRRLHSQYFTGIDRYYTPFFSPTTHRSLTPREARELPYADTLGYQMIPQLLTKVPEDFLWMAEQCAERGYSEVNLNLGCPSGTVTAKGKGAGMLRTPDELDAFLENIFKSCVLPISIKTRSGFTDNQEFTNLLEIYNRYPIKELIIHPRPRVAFYKGMPDMDVFTYAEKESNAPLCYNGNINSLQSAEAFSAAYPSVHSLMLGRGLIADPGMLMPGGTKREVLKAFHQNLLKEYVAQFGGPRNAMFRLKENWSFMIHKFENNEKLSKKLRKTTDITEFKNIVDEIFETLPMRSSIPDQW